MRIAKGIKGIRTHLNNNESGWHVIEGNHSMFYALTFKEMINLYPDYTIIMIAGNVIFIELTSV